MGKGLRRSLPTLLRRGGKKNVTAAAARPALAGEETDGILKFGEGEGAARVSAGLPTREDGLLVHEAEPVAERIAGVE